MVSKNGGRVAATSAFAPRGALDLSVPDAIVPEQYFDRLAARASDIPERRLMFAVLLDAVIQLRRRHSPDAAEAERWIRGEEDEDSPFSFRNVCEALGIDPSYLARGLLAWRAHHADTTVRVPVRQLRTSHRRVTPLGRRRRRRVTVIG
jgi:hypothetical protein